MADLQNNIYAHALGIVNPYSVFEYQDYDLPTGVEALTSAGTASGSGLPWYGIGAPGMKFHYHDKTGSGFFDFLRNAGKRVFSIIPKSVKNAASQAAQAGLDRLGKSASEAIASVGNRATNAVDRQLRRAIQP